MDTIFRFLASDAGRILRASAGTAMIAGGLRMVKGTWGMVMALVGLFPLFAGMFDLCLLAPLFGHSLRGEELRREVGSFEEIEYPRMERMVERT